MKYFSLSLLAFVFVLSVSTSVFAWSATSAGTLEFGGMSVPLSPGVTAGYTVDDWKGVNDWYVLGSYHNAGSKAYATASSISNMYESTLGTDTPLATAFAAIPQDYATAGSDALWSDDAGWK